MIELTAEQWQAIAQEEHPTAIEPESKTAYVVVRKDIYDKLCNIVDLDTAPASLLAAVAGIAGVELTEAEKALALRGIWMRRMGLDEEEIADSLHVDPPASVATEMTELLALERLKIITPTRAELEKIAIKCY